MTSSNRPSTILAASASVLELRRTDVGAVRICAPPELLARAMNVTDALSFPTAKDEGLLLSHPDDVTAIARRATDVLADRSSLVVDDTDSFAGWSLFGDKLETAFSYLSALPLRDSHRPALAQGLVAGIPAKVVADRGVILILVSSALEDYFAQRTLGACRTLGIIKGATQRFSLPALEVSSP